jgi:hypothetical protein
MTKARKKIGSEFQEFRKHETAFLIYQKILDILIEEDLQPSKMALKKLLNDLENAEENVKEKA